jgi:hypothetical protein
MCLSIIATANPLYVVECDVKNRKGKREKGRRRYYKIVGGPRYVVKNRMINVILSRSSKVEGVEKHIHESEKVVAKAKCIGR